MSDGESTSGKHRGLKEPWQPGQSGNPNGRPKGSRNKLGEAFLNDLLDDWVGNGVDAIRQMRMEKPGDYVRVVAMTLPKELNVKVSELDELSDDELLRRYDSLTKAIVTAGIGDRSGDTAPEASQPAPGISALH